MGQLRAIDNDEKAGIARRVGLKLHGTIVRVGDDFERCTVGLRLGESYQLKLLCRRRIPATVIAISGEMMPKTARLQCVVILSNDGIVL